MPKYRKVIWSVPPGEYQVEVVSAEERESKNGNETIALRLSIEGEGDARTFPDHLVFTESCYWKIAQFLTAMGEEATDDKDIRAADYVGRRARAVVGVQKFKGLPQNKIDAWLPAESATGEGTEAGSPEQPEKSKSAAVESSETGGAS
jgi:hypothetical protein